MGRLSFPRLRRPRPLSGAPIYYLLFTIYYLLPQVVLWGDYLALGSEGRVRSAVHRVLLPRRGKDRHSFTYFAYPPWDARYQMYFRCILAVFYMYLDKSVPHPRATRSPTPPAASVQVVL